MPIDTIYNKEKLTVAVIGFKLQVFTLFSKHIRRLFRGQRLKAVMGFTVLFLVATPFLRGQLTVAGPGVPRFTISGKVSAQLFIQYLNNQ
jgi:hypothetical protein